MAIYARGRLELAKQWKERDRTSQEGTKVCCESKTKRIPIVYYLFRNGHLEHPHFMEVSLSSRDNQLYLKGNRFRSTSFVSVLKHLFIYLFFPQISSVGLMCFEAREWRACTHGHSRGSLISKSFDLISDSDDPYSYSGATRPDSCGKIWARMTSSTHLKATSTSSKDPRFSASRRRLRRLSALLLHFLLPLSKL